MIEGKCKCVDVKEIEFILKVKWILCEYILVFLKDIGYSDFLYIKIE